MRAGMSTSRLEPQHPQKRQVELGLCDCLKPASRPDRGRYAIQLVDPQGPLAVHGLPRDSVPRRQQTPASCSAGGNRRPAGRRLVPVQFPGDPAQRLLAGPASGRSGGVASSTPRRRSCRRPATAQSTGRIAGSGLGGDLRRAPVRQPAPTIRLFSASCSSRNDHVRALEVDSVVECAGSSCCGSPKQRVLASPFATRSFSSSGITAATVAA